MFGQDRRVALFAVTLLLVFSLNNPANAATIAFKPPVSCRRLSISTGGWNPSNILDSKIDTDSRRSLRRQIIKPDEETRGAIG